MHEDTRALPLRLKSATREWHARAERSGVMAALLAGTLSRESYVALLANLRALYAELEPQLQSMHPSWVLQTRLTREPALAADLHAWGAGPARLVQATHQYRERLRELHGPLAHRLWAHVYVRYLGDLHGGQLLSRQVRRLYGPSVSVRFYDFGSSEQVHGLREALREQLASLALEVTQADEVVAEAVSAFEAHCRMFEEIGGATAG